MHIFWCPCYHSKFNWLHRINVLSSPIKFYLEKCRSLIVKGFESTFIMLQRKRKRFKVLHSGQSMELSRFDLSLHPGFGSFIRDPCEVGGHFLMTPNVKPNAVCVWLMCFRVSSCAPFRVCCDSWVYPPDKMSHRIDSVFCLVNRKHALLGFQTPRENGLHSRPKVALMSTCFFYRALIRRTALTWLLRHE